ncbi:MAG: Transcriptional regulatory protein QseB [Stenotrophomonas maltophilia]|uniref:Transcriptional regulatory protein QseB n=1 Tax=Stenotrophomonas maltophilia TaxID=40324 RepID=A0A7V8FIW2_STEMA|nr:MAG: Transcriptional regulatory protein QseB [Stenotrophomonas maltophilia]
MNLLLVEDDAMLAEAICDGARQLGWQVAHARSAEAARACMDGHAFAAVLLDIGLPGESGLGWLRWLRRSHDPLPVLLITARAQLSSRIRGLDDGADDYLVKPFELDELHARLRALVRRSQGSFAPVLCRGSVCLDPHRRLVTQHGAPVQLSLYEYRLLLALLQNPGRVLARDTLERHVYGNDLRVESNTVAVFVHQLRRKLGEGIVVTQHGLGYRLGDAP